METILIATDFSRAAHSALEYGVELAKCVSAKVVLLHVCQPVLGAADTVEVLTPQEITECAEQGLKDEVETIAARADVSIDIRTEEGLPSQTIEWVAKEEKAKWVVAGMKGKGKAMRRIFGSVVSSLSRRLHIPLIVVPEDARFAVPGTIALASDLGFDTDVHILDPLEKLGEKFGSTMYIVRVIKKGMDELIERLLRPMRLKWYCKKLHPSFEFINNDDVTHAINDFVKEHHVDMVAMIAHEQNIFERLFVKSNVKEMLLHLQVPLIILPGKVDTSPTDAVDDSIEMGHA